MLHRSNIKELGRGEERRTSKFPDMTRADRSNSWGGRSKTRRRYMDMDQMNHKNFFPLHGLVTAVTLLGPSEQDIGSKPSVGKLHSAITEDTFYATSLTRQLFVHPGYQITTVLLLLFHIIYQSSWQRRIFLFVKENEARRLA
jgi:hypothetical protein